MREVNQHSHIQVLFHIFSSEDSNLSKGLPVIKHVKHTKAFAYNYYFKVPIQDYRTNWFFTDCLVQIIRGDVMRTQ